MDGLTVFLLFPIFGVNSHHFGYSRVDQYNWRNISNDCASSLQSPIRIDSNYAIPLRMPALEMVRYHDLLPGPLELQNNGHTVSLNIPKQKVDYKYMPYIFGAKLNNEYELEALHFHWGKRNNEGSEHIMNDIRYPLEMHIIHRNRKYSSVPEAIKYKDGLSVLGFFFQIREKENRNLAHLIKHFDEIENYNSTYKMNNTFPLASLVSLGDDMERFYTYKGSLTTPPCSEAVTWILFPDPLPISIGQMSKFRKLKSDEYETPLIHNYREVQKLGPRRIFMRKLRPRGYKYNANIDYNKWDWLVPLL